MFKKFVGVIAALGIGAVVGTILGVRKKKGTDEESLKAKLSNWVLNGTEVVYSKALDWYLKEHASPDEDGVEEDSTYWENYGMDENEGEAYQAIPKPIEKKVSGNTDGDTDKNVESLLSDLSSLLSDGVSGADTNSVIEEIITGISDVDNGNEAEVTNS